MNDTPSEYDYGEEPGVDEPIHFHRNHLWIGDVEMTPWDCPPCLRGRRGNCPSCLYFDPFSCPISRNAALQEDVTVLFEIARQRRAEQRAERYARWKEVALALRSELTAHGRPLHYSVLTKMLARRHRRLKVNEAEVIVALSRFPDMFEKIDEGVYRAR